MKHSRAVQKAVASALLAVLIAGSMAASNAVRAGGPEPPTPSPDATEPAPTPADLEAQGANCSSPTVFDDQWASGFRLVCQNNLYVLMVDLTNPAIKVEVKAASSGTNTVSSFADSNTIAIINADYQWCSSGAICSQGLTISNGSSPSTYTNLSHLCSDAKVRREIGFSQDGHVAIDWWYRFVSNSQAQAWCGSLPGSGGGMEQYSYNLVGAGPQFTFDGTFHWDCQYGQNSTTHNCLASGNDVGINGEHFGPGDWWNRYQSAIGYTTDGTVLVLGESNNQTHSMQNVHDLFYQTLSGYGKTLKNAFKFDGGSKAGFWYYNGAYSSTPGVYVPNVIRVQRTNSTCYSLSTNANPGGSGSVSVNTPANCAQGKYWPGTGVQIQASANSGYSFSNWSGAVSGSSNPVTITMNGNKSVTANFSPTQTCYSLSTAVSLGGSGSVSVSPGSNCSGGKYTSGTVVTLTAAPSAGYGFSSWSGSAGGSSNPTTVTMNGDRSVTANFSTSTVKAIGVWIGDGNWGLKSSFAPGDPLQWGINVGNTTGASAPAVVTWRVTNPLGSVSVPWSGTLTIAAGEQVWALPGTAAKLGGTYTFTGSVSYLGTTTSYSTTYTVSHLFSDVPVGGKEWMEPWILGFYNAGITSGCGANPLRYCPENNVTRAEMAVFALRARHGSTYQPPAASGIFSDVPVAGKEWMRPWIEQFYREGITSGCGTNPLRYCPENNVTRAEMAVFLLRAKHGASYQPPGATGIFSDVPVAGKEWMRPWIEQFYREGVTSGCGSNPLRYCPENSTTRGEMAVFISRAFGIAQITSLGNDQDVEIPQVR